MVFAVILTVTFFTLIYIFIFRKNDNASVTNEVDVDNTPKFSTDYLFGHPLIAKPEPVYLLREENDLIIIERNLYAQTSFSHKLGTIPLYAIAGIEVEDHSSVEKKFSLGKYMLVGTYAFAFPKKEERETGYLIIEWKINNTEYTALFLNKDEGALKRMQQARNVFLHWAQSARNEKTN